MTGEINSEEIVKEARRILIKFAKRLDSRLIPRDDNQAYLWRGYLSGGDSDVEYSGFLHRFLSSDQIGEKHCHPWRESVSIILLGAYREFSCEGTDAPDGKKILSPQVTRDFFPGHKNLIKANTFHRVELLTPEVWTLFIHGSRVQPWGFVKEGIYDHPLDIRIVQGKTSKNLPKVAVEEVVE